MNPWALMRYVFCKLFCPCKDHHHHRRKLRANVGVTFGAFAVHFQGDFMFTLPDDKTVGVSIAYVDAKGNPAQVEGAPVWSSSDESILTVTAAADGLSAVVTPAGPLGSAQVKVTADADLGAGVTEIVTLGDVEVIAGSAVAGVLTFGSPA